MESRTTSSGSFSTTTMHGRLLVVRTTLAWSNLNRPASLRTIRMIWRPRRTSTTTRPRGLRTYQALRRKTSYRVCNEATDWFCPVMMPQGRFVTTASTDPSASTCLRRDRASLQTNRQIDESLYPSATALARAPLALRRETSMPRQFFRFPLCISRASSRSVPDPQKGSSSVFPSLTLASRIMAYARLVLMVTAFRYRAKWRPLDRSWTLICVASTTRLPITSART
mmetsp:Transcript_22026/g.61302  ORF Transcript_22026/g.61302 Transcript_22026/m.61302 type:complete len:226 (+) Transcript_22026:125-802(+)